MPSKANTVNKTQASAKKADTTKHVSSSSDEETPETTPQATKVVKKQEAQPKKADATATKAKKKAESSEEESSSSDEEQVVVRVAQKKPAAKPAKKAETSSEEESESEEESSEEESEEEKPAKKAAPAAKKPAPKKKESSSEEESSEEEEAPKKAPVKKPAPKKKESSSEEESSEEEEKATPAGKATAKGKAPQGKGAKAKENLEDILGEFAGEGGTQQLSKAQLKRLKKKEVPAPTTEQPQKPAEAQKDVEAVTDGVAAVKISTGEAPAAAGAATPTPAGGATPTPAEEDGKDEKKLSKAQKERLRKKEKEAKEKEAAAKPVEAAAPAAPETKKVSALGARLKKQQEEMERAKKAEADRIAAEEAAEAARIAEEKRVAEEAAKKKADKIAKREADKKAGLIKSAAEKKKEAAARQAVEAMKAAGMLVGVAAGEAAEGEVKKKRPVYGKKKVNKPKDKEEGTPKSEEPTPKAVEVVVEDSEERKKEEKQAKLDEIPEEEPDWEAMMASSDPGEQEEKASWDVDSDEERAQEAERKAAHEKRKAVRVADVTKQKTAYAEREAARKARVARAKAKKAAEEAKKAEEAKNTAEPAAEAASTGKDEESNKRKDMRSPICCILGHVDTGKTKLLDKIRHTNVQEGEAGGITQQIGATYFPTETIKSQTVELQQYIHKELEIKVPGLLVIDTPGHESFSNLRSRGSGLCDIAILVVDIMAGLEKQTLESIKLLKMRKTPFVVALNKCDRMYGWKAIPNCPFKKTLDTQTVDAQQEFDRRLRQIIVQFAELEALNTCLYWENKDFKRNVSIIPTSAITGEGVPDLLMLLIQLCQKMMNEKLMYLSELQCTVLEVKVIVGHGTTIDVVLANGVLHEGDTIVICGMQGPIVTKIRALLTPPPLRELRVKNDYVHHKTVKAAMGLKISAPNLESAVPGSQLMVCGPRDDVETLKDEVMQDLATILSQVDRSGIGVCVQASTLGSLEALLTFLKESKIPVSGIAIGPVHKKDVMRAAIMLEKRREFAIILAFDVAVSAEAQQWARDMGVQIFTANIIYHLFDMCTNYMEEVRTRSIQAAADTIVWPCILEVMPDCVFRDRAPLLLGVRVKEGFVKLGTPLCVPSKEMLILGKITSVEKNHVEVKEAKAGDEVCIKIEAPAHEQKIMFGRHFDYADHLYSKLSRQSIDQLKLHFKDSLTEDEWKFVKRLKPIFGIM